MKLIELTQGQAAIVDDEDYEELNQHKWYAQWNKGTKSFYAGRKGKTKNGKRIHLGLYDCPVLAHNAYLQAKMQYHKINKKERNIICQSK